jgi:hypothetical protein
MKTSLNGIDCYRTVVCGGLSYKSHPKGPIMRLPSVKTLLRIADCNEDAREMRKILERYHNRPHKMLSEVSKFIGACGVEYIEPAEPSQYEDRGLYYINVGDTYITTLCYDSEKNRIIVSSWGDIVEKNQKRFR